MLWAFYLFGLIVLAICLYGLLVMLRRFRRQRAATGTTILSVERPSDRPRRGGRCWQVR